jgi:hypothetical protein
MPPTVVLVAAREKSAAAAHSPVKHCRSHHPMQVPNDYVVCNITGAFAFGPGRIESSLLSIFSPHPPIVHLILHTRGCILILVVTNSFSRANVSCIAFSPAPLPPGHLLPLGFSIDHRRVPGTSFSPSHSHCMTTTHGIQLPHWGRK